MADWSIDFCLLFVELYRKESILWDSSHPYHKERKKVNNAWVRISEVLQRPVEEVKKKKDSLMATFRGHLRRKKASIASGAEAEDVYKPVWFAYECMENFLAPDCTMNINTPQPSYDSPVNETIFEEDPEVETAQLPSSVTTSTSIPTITSSAQPTILRRRTNHDLHKASIQMKEAFNSPQNVISKRAVDQEEDECDWYGKILAKKLRKLPEYDRQILMYDIDGIFIRRMRPTESSEANIHANTTIFPEICDSQSNLQEIEEDENIIGSVKIEEDHFDDTNLEDKSTSYVDFS